MSAVSDAAVVRITLADYVANDAAGKLNMIGGGLSVVGIPTGKDAIGPLPHNTAPFGIAVSVAVGPDHFGASCTAEILLEDPDGQVVQLPSGESPQTGSTTVHLHEDLVFPTPTFAEQLNVPPGAVRARWSAAIMLPTGLPLPPGNTYVLRVRIDGVSRDDWTEHFYVPAVDAE